MKHAKITSILGKGIRIFIIIIFLFYFIGGKYKQSGGIINILYVMSNLLLLTPKYKNNPLIRKLTAFQSFLIAGILIYAIIKFGKNMFSIMPIYFYIMPTFFILFGFRDYYISLYPPKNK